MADPIGDAAAGGGMGDPAPPAPAEVPPIIVGSMATAYPRRFRRNILRFGRPGAVCPTAMVLVPLFIPLDDIGPVCEPEGGGMMPLRRAIRRPG